MKKLKEDNKILLTGGHAATTAIAVVEELIRQGYGSNLYWIGPRRAIEGRKAKPLETDSLPNLGVKTHAIQAGRLQRRFTKHTLPSLLKIPFGFFQAFFLVWKIKPAVVLSFGGFSSFPVVLTAWFLGIPVLIHEQTAAAGLANRLAAPLAKKIFLAREESKRYFKKEKCLVTGNPIMTQIIEVTPKAVLGKPPVLLITLGSRGSEIVNRVLFEALDKLLEKYRVIHLTGEADYEKFSVKKNFRYEVFPWVDPLKIDNLYREADLVLARAGANTVAEIMAVKRPSLLIPIPWSYLNEQVLNAEMAIRFGIAEILPQEGLTAEKLIAAANRLLLNSTRMITLVKNKKTGDAGAAKRIVNVLKEYLA